MDYGSIIWFPTTYNKIEQMEQIIRLFTKKVPAITHLHPWDRMKELDISSYQRRVERYQIITLWKIMEGMLPGKDFINVVWARKGREVIPPRPPLNVSNTVVKLRMDSFFHRGGILFNSCPRDIRDTTGVSMEVFKKKLNKYLRWMPDHPRDPSSGFFPQAYDPVKQTSSNSIVHWRALMEREFPTYNW